MFFVYILRSMKDEGFYIGYTNDLERRVEEHNKGHTFSTKSRLPLKLIYYESYLSEQDAKKREEQLKLHGRVFAQLKRRLEDTMRLA